MKMIYCTCDVSILDELTDLLEKSEISDYQVIEKVIAKNREGDPRYNTPVWPGYNSSVLMQVREDQKVNRVITNVKEYNKGVVHKDELITLCTWTLDDYVFD